GDGFRNKIYHDLAWQPIWKHIGVLGDGISNLDKPAGLLFITGQPRVDIWWLDDRWWLLKHPNRLAFLIIMLTVIVALGVFGYRMIRGELNKPVAAAAPPKAP